MSVHVAHETGPKRRATNGLDHSQGRVDHTCTTTDKNGGVDTHRTFSRHVPSRSSLSFCRGMARQVHSEASKVGSPMA